MNTRLTRFATAGELADFYADKMQDAQIQLSAMVQTISQARLDLDGCSDVQLVDYIRSLIAIEDELKRMTDNYNWYAKFKPDTIANGLAPF